MPTSTRHHPDVVTCSFCGKSFKRKDVVPSAAIRTTVVEAIQKEKPDWQPTGFLCRPDLNHFRQRHVEDLLASERGDLGNLEKEVVDSLRDHEVLARNVGEEAAATWTTGQRVADKVASFGGSWPFIGLFSAFLAVWILLNSLLSKPADPFPFILLNLLLSCLAAVQAPIIMMSQNRQQARDRLEANNDYQVNLKAELEIRHLHEKLDHLLSHQWERLAEIQEIQLELLEEISRRR